MEKEEFISERQASILLDVDPSSMKMWRDKKIIEEGLYIVKRYPAMKRIFYKKNELLEWAKSFNG